MTAVDGKVPDRFRLARALITELFGEALASVEPAAATASVLRRDDDRLTIGSETIPVTGRVVVVGMGKAATAMARGAESVLGDAITTGLVVTTDGQVDKDVPERIAVTQAAHPLPDGRSLAAGARLLELVQSTAPDDVVIALISGGGSSLVESLRPPLALDDLRAVTDLLLRAGATIGELNTVRRALSRIKAGGLLSQSVAPVYPLILSDVIGNDPATIASGAVIPGPPFATQAAAALRCLGRHGLTDRVPLAVAVLLRTAVNEADRADVRPVQAPVFVGDNARAVQAVARGAETRGLAVSCPPAWQDREGEAAELGPAFVQACRDAGPDVDLVVGGGEATVTVQGAGVGGRNTEFALAAALALDAGGATGWVIGSLATDGQDGPTGAAGAIADGGTVARCRTHGIDPDQSLRENDSLRVFEVAGGLVSTGATGTNVNDLYIGVRVRQDGNDVSAKEMRA